MKKPRLKRIVMLLLNIPSPFAEIVKPVHVMTNEVVLHMAFQI